MSIDHRFEEVDADHTKLSDVQPASIDALEETSNGRPEKHVVDGKGLMADVQQRAYCVFVAAKGVPACEPTHMWQKLPDNFWGF